MAEKNHTKGASLAAVLRNSSRRQPAKHIHLEIFFRESIGFIVNSLLLNEYL
jgi:hypothetical protein